MGPDFSVNGYSFDLDSDEFDLESILREYENYDPDAPAQAPRAKAAFESRPIPAEIIDEPDTPEEPLGPLEQALAAPDPEPEEPDDAEHDDAPEEEAGADPFASYAEDYPEADTPEAAKHSSKLLRGTWRETLGLPEKPDEPDEDVHEYHPGDFHGQRPRLDGRRRDAGAHARLRAGRHGLRGQGPDGDRGHGLRGAAAGRRIRRGEAHRLARAHLRAGHGERLAGAADQPRGQRVAAG